MLEARVNGFDDSVASSARSSTATTLQGDGHAPVAARDWRGLPPDGLLLRRRVEAAHRRASTSPTCPTVALAELEAFDPALPHEGRPHARRVLLDGDARRCRGTCSGTRPDLDEVTYLDADLLFFDDPEPLFEAMGRRLGADHAAPLRAQDTPPGDQRDLQRPVPRPSAATAAAGGAPWWHDRCVEWCYYRLEDGKLGDQKYLDDWPERFEGVHVLEHKGGGLAPWNITQYDVRADGRDGRSSTRTRSSSSTTTASSSPSDGDHAGSRRATTYPAATTDSSTNLICERWTARQ